MNQEEEPYDVYIRPECRPARNVERRKLYVIWKNEALHREKLERKIGIITNPVAEVQGYQNHYYICAFVVFWALCAYYVFTRYNSPGTEVDVDNGDDEDDQNTSSRDYDCEYAPKQERILELLERIESDYNDTEKLYDVGVSVDYRIKFGTDDDMVNKFVTKKYKLRNIQERTVADLKKFFKVHFDAIHVVLESVEMVEKDPE